MKNIKRYKEFISEELTADMPPKAPIEISYEKPDDKYSTEDTYVFNPSDTLHKVTKSKSEMEKMTKYQHWTLDSTQINIKWDTIVKKAGDTLVKVLEMKLSDDQYFSSGSFNVDMSIKNKIDSLLREVNNNNYLITDIGIESSTDKQPVGPKVKKNLENNGYIGDNTGLAEARAESISNYLIQSGVHDSLIQINALPEQDFGGADENGREQAARYVTVRISVLSFKKEDLPVIIEIIPIVKKTYYLSKPVENDGGSYKFKGFKVTSLGHIKNNDRKTVKKCVLPGSKVKYNKRTGLYSNH